MGQRTKLYVLCLIVFTVAFAGFVVGFGCPVWIASGSGDQNEGLWQSCQRIFRDCKTLDFDDGRDWMIGVRAVEIFALVMLSVAAAELAYETCCSSFSRRLCAERAAPGVLCILGGCGGLAGVILFMVKMTNAVTASSGPVIDYSWGLFLVAAGSGLALLLGVGFCVSGCVLEKPDEADKAPLYAHGGDPYSQPSSQGVDSHEMTTAFTNKALAVGSGQALSRSSSSNPYPGHALYNHRPQSVSQSVPAHDPSGDHYSRVGPPVRTDPYYAYHGARVSQTDFSEGYLPSRRLEEDKMESYVRSLGYGQDPYVRDLPAPEDSSFERDLESAADYYVPTDARFVHPHLYRVEAAAPAPRAEYSESSRYLSARGEGMRGYYEDTIYRPGRY